MACLRKLKTDIALLGELFPADHERLQTISASLDEIVIGFIDDTGKKIILNANILEEYPQQAPIWFSEDERTVVTTVLGHLSEDNSHSHILHQIYQLTNELCSAFNVPTPLSLERFAPEQKDKQEDDLEMATEEDDDDEEIDDDDGQESDADLEIEDKEVSTGGVPSAAGQQFLDKVTQSQRKKHLEGKKQGSVIASDRLMKEIRDIVKGDHYKQGVYTFELLNDDNLYEWHVKLFKVDPDSQLASDILKMAQDKGQDHILFHFMFNADYPFEPPFVRLISPAIEGGFVTRSGAICLELLTKQGWSSAYSIESVILQISASLASAKARILFDQKPNYTMEGALRSFKTLVEVHSRRGWMPESNDG